MRRPIGILLAATTAAAALGAALAAPMPAPLADAAASSDRRATAFPTGAIHDDTSGLTARAPSLTRTGVLEPRPGIAVADLAIDAGEWTVTYSFEARLDSVASPDALVCGVVDANARPRYFTQDQEPVFSGSGWTDRTATAMFSLPAMTLGLRCNLVGTGLGSVAFRDVQLSVIPMDTASG